MSYVEEKKEEETCRFYFLPYTAKNVYFSFMFSYTHPQNGGVCANFYKTKQ